MAQLFIHGEYFSRGACGAPDTNYFVFSTDKPRTCGRPLPRYFNENSNGISSFLTGIEARERYLFGIPTDRLRMVKVRDLTDDVIVAFGGDWFAKNKIPDSWASIHKVAGGMPYVRLAEEKKILAEYSGAFIYVLPKYFWQVRKDWRPTKLFDGIKK